MKISLNWLNEFVDLSNIKIEDIVSRFSLCTAEIEGYEVKGIDKSVVVGEIKTCKQVEGKKLSVLTVFDGKKNHQVVCGAPNVKEGLKVIYAPAGASLGGVKLEVKTIAGVESHGMCLSEQELGVSDDHSGIIGLYGVPVGKSILEEMPYLCDTIIEIDNKSITNRPDLWGHYGIARELATIFDKPLKPLAVEDLEQYAKLPAVPVKIESDLCHSYGAIRVENITRKVSPLEMRVRLFYLEINSHGFLVDLSNYLMFEVGQPNHAFDATKIGEISVGHINTPSSPVGDATPLKQRGIPDADFFASKK